MQFVVLTGLTGGPGLDYRLATALAVAAAVVHNFAWHRGWTWADRAPGRPTAVLFSQFALANGLVSLAGNVAGMWLLVGGAGMPVLPANAVVIAFCGLANYWLADRVVFGNPGRDRPGARKCRIAGP